MYRYIFIFICLIIAQSAAGQSFYDLRQIPRDTLTATQTKIWIPVEAKSCSVTVKILDNDNNLVRKLLNQKLYQGYYNIYWDKKDDSGQFVPDTTYRIAVLSCTYRKIFPIEVSFQTGENSAIIKSADNKDNPALIVDFLEPAVTASLEIYNRREILVDSVYTDTTYNNGIVHIPWNPSPRFSPGNYFFKLTLNGYPHWIPFKYKI